MATRKQLCDVHFPRGLDDQPAGATVVSCEHGSWPGPAAKPAKPARRKTADADRDEQR